MGFTTHTDELDAPRTMTPMIFDFEDPRHREKKTLAGWLYPKLFSPG
jgi:hypothetical protein